MVRLPSGATGTGCMDPGALLSHSTHRAPTCWDSHAMLHPGSQSTTRPRAGTTAMGPCQVTVAGARGWVGRRDVLPGAPGTRRLEASPGHSTAQCSCLDRQEPLWVLGGLAPGFCAAHPCGTRWQPRHYACSCLSPASSVMQLYPALLPQVTASYLPAAAAA